MQTLSHEEYSMVIYIITTFMDTKEMSRSMIDAMWALAYIAENADDAYITNRGGKKNYYLCKNKEYEKGE